MPAITPNLWFDKEAKDAAEFYCSVFPNSRVTNISHYGEAGPGEAGTVLTVDWELDGQRFTGINGGPMFPQTEAVSFLISCQDQDEVDYYWDALTANGGSESQCGWCKDRYGVSWQVVPVQLEAMITDPDEERRNRGMAAMLQMQKIDLAALQRAADGDPA